MREVSPSQYPTGGGSESVKSAAVESERNRMDRRKGDWLIKEDEEVTHEKKDLMGMEHNSNGE